MGHTITCGVDRYTGSLGLNKVLIWPVTNIFTCRVDEEKKKEAMGDRRDTRGNIEEAAGRRLS